MSNGFQKRAVLARDRSMVAVEALKQGEWELVDWAFVDTDPDTALAGMGFDRTEAWDGSFAGLRHAAKAVA